MNENDIKLKLMILKEKGLQKRREEDIRLRKKAEKEISDKKAAQKKFLKGVDTWARKKITYKSSPKSRASIVVKKGEGRWL